MQSSPKETLITIARENRILRWLTILLGLAVVSTGMAVYFAVNKPNYVWVVMENGKISNNKGLFFRWEAETAAQRAMEIFYIRSEEREKLLPAYFTGELMEKPNVKNYKAYDRLVKFHIEKIEGESDIRVAGALRREGRTEDEKFVVKLVKVERTDFNPFGLKVAEIERVAEKVEEVREGLGAIESAPSASEQERSGQP